MGATLWPTLVGDLELSAAVVDCTVVALAMWAPFVSEPVGWTCSWALRVGSG